MLSSSAVLYLGFLCTLTTGLDVEPVQSLSRTTVDLSSTAAASLAANLVYIVPVLIFIIILDFAIFGAYAKRSDNLNPVSDFFYHVRRGFGIVRQKSAVHRPPRYGRLDVLTLLERG